jgi:hypothetical protein
MTKCLIQRKRKTSTKTLHEAGLHRDDDWETNRLEVHEVLSVVRHVSRYWTAVGYTQEDQKVEKASVSTQLVLSKYNTNHEALRLADTTALAFKSWQILLRLFTKVDELPWTHIS